MNVGRQKSLLLAVACLLAVLAWAAAPALSTRAYMPEAVDFEQKLGAVARVAPTGAAERAVKREGPITHVSDVIEAPHRFDLAGLAGELRDLELRAREDGGEWSAWVETSNGDPVYFGGADELQVRTRGWRPHGTLHYVNVSGTASTGSSLLNSFREAVNSAFIGAASVVGPAPAEALPTRPPIMSRGEWGATRADGGCKPRETPERGLVKSAVVHHTVTAGKYTAAEAPSIVLGICRYHRNGNGWNDIGYNALVDRFGNLYAGRAGGLNRAAIGAHAQGFNSVTTGIAAIGTHTTTPLTPATQESIVAYLAWKLSAHAIPAQGRATMTSAGGAASRYDEGQRIRLRRIIGHRAVGRTSCPGDAAYLQLPAIRRLTQERIDAGGGTPPAPPPTEPTGPTEPAAPADPADPNGGTVPK